MLLQPELLLSKGYRRCYISKIGHIRRYRAATNKGYTDKNIFKSRNCKKALFDKPFISLQYLLRSKKVFYFQRMRKLLILCIYLPIVVLAIPKNPHVFRGYKVEGYILLSTDTIRGYISIPLHGDEVDYSSLTKKVVFVDSLGESKMYRPDDIPGFGMHNDDVTSHYISVTKTGSSSKKIFLKKLVEGAVMLLVETIDRAGGYGHITSNGINYGSTYENDMSRVYYLRIGNARIVQMPFDEKTATIRKFELKKLLINLPESFTTSNERVEFSTFLTLLQNYNADITKKE